jgi:regulatory protein
VIDEVIKWLTDNKYLDDNAFAAQWLSYRERLNPKGFMLIKRELSSLGISEEIIQRVLGNADEEENAFNAVLRFAVRRYRLGVDERELYDSVYRYLKRRGFNERTIALVKPRVSAALFS